jgi:beta-glucosidase
VCITENGMADSHNADPLDDQERIHYVRGHYLWSLLDNNDWGSGLSLRYGIAHVHPDLLKRTPKASFGWCRDVISH